MRNTNWNDENDIYVQIRLYEEMNTLDSFRSRVYSEKIRFGIISGSAFRKKPAHSEEILVDR